MNPLRRRAFIGLGVLVLLSALYAALRALPGADHAFWQPLAAPGTTPTENAPTATVPSAIAPIHTATPPVLPTASASPVAPRVLTATPTPAATGVTAPSPTARPALTAVTPTATATSAPLATATPTEAPAPPTLAAGASRVDLADTDPRFGIDEAYQRPLQANALGARWSRIPFIWRYIQPAGPDSWNAFALGSRGSDAVVNDELARGRAIAGLLLGTPAWARRNPAWGEASVPVNIELPWTDPKNYWAAYCYKMARHFAGRIDDWIIWNEVSIPPGKDGQAGLWTQWRGTPEQYARVLEVAYQAIHAANPRAQVVLYGDPYWYDHGAYLAHLFDLLARADPSGRAHGFFDAANLHLYSNPSDFYPIVTGLRALLTQHGWARTPIWISETNAEPYDDPAHPAPHTNFRVSEQAQAAFLVDAFAADLAAGVDRIEVYRMDDGAARGAPAWGLVDDAGQPRPIARTFHFLTWLFRDVSGGDYTPGAAFDGKGGVFTVVVRKPGARITVLWNQAGTAATAHLPAHATTATLYDKYGAARTIAPARGAYTLHLPGGSDFTNPYDPRVPTVGGDPSIVVEHIDGR